MCRTLPFSACASITDPLCMPLGSAHCTGESVFDMERADLDTRYVPIAPEAAKARSWMACSWGAFMASAFWRVCACTLSMLAQRPREWEPHASTSCMVWRGGSSSLCCVYACVYVLERACGAGRHESSLIISPPVSHAGGVGVHLHSKPDQLHARTLLQQGELHSKSTTLKQPLLSAFAYASRPFHSVFVSRTARCAGGGGWVDMNQFLNQFRVCFAS